MDWHPGAEFRSFERVSVSTVDDDHCETQRAALERAFAKQLAAREVVLVAGKDGEWRAMKLRKLKAGDRQELMDKVFATPQDERQGFHMKVADRLAK
jgi:DNA-binding cell septation regulator SpoVG